MDNEESFSCRVGNRMIQQVFITEQDGKIEIPFKESTVACHLRATPYRYNEKIV